MNPQILLQSAALSYARVLLMVKGNLLSYIYRTKADLFVKHHFWLCLKQQALSGKRAKNNRGLNERAFGYGNFTPTTL